MDGWRWLLIIGASGVIALVWMRRGLPESPRWLVSVGRTADADAQLRVIEDEVERRSGAELPEPDYSSMPTDVSGGTHRKARISDLFRGDTRNAMIAVGALWSIGVLAYYGFSSLAPVLLMDKGYDITKSLLYTAVIAVGYPLGALTAALIAERLERRTLAVITALATAVAGLVFGYGSGDVLIMAAGFGLGFASNIHSSCTNMYASEVFPTRLRSTAIGLCYGSGRLFALALPFLGLTVLDTFGGSAVLLMSAVLFIVTAALVWIFGPKTTGRSLEEITEATPSA
jgi:putative MFS transporter